MELHHTAVKEEKGFSAVEVLLSLIIVLLIGFIGYYVYTTKHNADDTLTAASKSATTPAPKIAKKAIATAAASDPNDLQITEWGVQLNFADASKVTYKISANGLAFYLLPSVTSDAQCQNLAVGINRYTQPASGNVDEGKTPVKIGGYHYYLGGAPGSCGGSASIEQLRTSLITSEIPNAFPKLAASQ